MIEEIPVYFTDPKYIRNFNDHPKFEHPSQYSPQEYQKTSQEEWGKLKLGFPFNLRLILDSGRNTKCPWCDCDHVEVIPVDSKQFWTRFAAYCQNCGARGPVMNLSNTNLDKEEILNEAKDMIKQRWACRIPKGRKVNEC